MNYVITKLHEQSLWKTDSCLAGQEIPHLYGTQSFITMFTRAHHWALSQASLIHSTLLHSTTSVHFSIMLPSMLRSSSVVFPSLHAFYISHSYHSSWFDHQKSKNYEAPQYVIFSIFNIFFSHTSKLFSFLRGERPSFTQVQNSRYSICMF
jgi:hypothetical protein